MGIIDLITLLVFLTALFTLFNLIVLKLPTTIGLMVIAMMTSMAILALGYVYPNVREGAEHVMESIDFEEVLIGIMLNFLLFAGALSVDLGKLLEQRTPIIILAFVSTFLSVFITGYLMSLIMPLLGIEIDLIYYLLFGALISPTDPVAVLALIKKVGLAKRLEIQIAGESLFNDGIGVVVYLTLLSVAVTGTDSFNLGGTTLLFAQQVFGGLILGAVFGYVGFKMLDHVDNEHMELEVLITLGLVLVGSRLAVVLGASSAIAMVVTGLFVGNEGRDEKLANATGKYVFKFWHLMDEALNGILFILIGLEMILIAHSFDLNSIIIGVSGIVIVLIARYIGVFIPVKIMSFFREFEPKTILILTWGGLRGGIPVALALSLSELHWKPEVINTILIATYAVVVFSIIVQGMTVSKLLKKG